MIDYQYLVMGSLGVGAGYLNLTKIQQSIFVKFGQGYSFDEISDNLDDLSKLVPISCNKKNYDCCDEPETIEDDDATICINCGSHLGYDDVK